MDIHEILKRLPHRYPFLLVDRVVELEKGKRIVALKNVTMNEPFFTGHFPNRPVMPGVMMLEALAQAAAILAFDNIGVMPDDKTVFYFVGIDNARFKRPVEPGRSVDAACRTRPQQRRHRQVQVVREGRRERGRLGRPDVHDAPTRLIRSAHRDMASIHSTAIIEAGAELDAGVSVGAYSIVREHARIGAGTTIGPHCVVEATPRSAATTTSSSFARSVPCRRTRSTPVNRRTPHR